MSLKGQPVQPGGNGAADDLRIESWKQIAAFFGRDQRTVKRWEKTRKLPVRRLPGEKGGVFAYSRELTEWLNSSGQVEADSAGTSQGFAAPGGDFPVSADSTPGGAANADAAPGIGRAHWYAILAAAALVLICVIAVVSIAHRRFTAKAEISPSVSASRSAAQELYLEGRFEWSHRSPKSLQKAMEDFNKAIARDPGFAPAYAGLADCYNLMPQYSGAFSSEVFPQAISAARKALALDNSLPEAHRALAFGLFYGDWDVNTAFREYLRAIELAPADAETHSWYANSLMLLGRTSEAAAEIARARELNPTSRSILANQAFVLYNTGERASGVEKLKAVEAAEPDFLGASGYLAQIYFWDGNDAAYVAELKHMAEVSGEADQALLAEQAEQAWSSSGERGLLKQLRSAYLDAFRSGKSSGYELALVDSRLGLRQEADQFFQAALNARDYRMMAVLSGKFDSVMAGDRDFLNIKRQVRLRIQL